MTAWLPRGQHPILVRVNFLFLPYLPLLLLVALLSVFLPLKSEAAVPAPAPVPALSAGFENLALPPPGAQPVRVAMAFRLHQLHSIEDEAETFDLSGILTLRWQDSRQAFDPAEEGVAKKVFSGNYQFNEISPGWFPQVVLSNAVITPDSQGVVYSVAPDGSSTMVQHFHAAARSQLQLRRFPFDEQTLQLVFEVLGFDDTEVTLVADTGGATMADGVFHVPEWQLRNISIAPGGAAGSDNESVVRSSAVTVQLGVERKSFFMIRLVVGPLALIVLLSWSVFWMERSSLGDRMAVSFVGILTAVAYQSMVSDIMPNIAYVTFLNAFMVMSMFLMSATVAVNLVVAGFDKRGDIVLGDRIDRACRWGFPLLYAIMTGLSVVVTFFLL